MAEPKATPAGAQPPARRGPMVDLDPSGQVTLRAENPEFPHLVLPELSEMTVWGVVTFIISPAS